jgi:hypothetical protein
MGVGPTARWAAIAAALVVGPLASCSGDDSEERQQDVAERGEAVMPFDLEATTHSFVPTPDGLIETIVANDADDAVNIRLIREHLQAEQARFDLGDYADPEAIHGEQMPGLAELEASAGDVTVTFAEIASGARLLFRTSEPELVDALRRWGEAQTSDHGEHAAQS